MAMSSDALRKAILSALPIDYDDRTTLVQVVLGKDAEDSLPRYVWGAPERLADAILDAIRPHVQASVEWGVRRSDGRVITVEDESEARAIAPQFRPGMVLVSRRIGPWEEVRDVDA